jgi:hypothetical protein
MTSSRQYDALRIEPEEVVGLVRDGDDIVVPLAEGETPTLLEALSEHRERLHGVTVSQPLRPGRSATSTR